MRDKGYGGEIERMPLRDHYYLYFDDHGEQHVRQLREMEMSSTSNPTGRTGFFTRHPELEAEAIRLRAQGLINREVAARLSKLAGEGITDEGVRVMLKSVPFATFNEMVVSGEMDKPPMETYANAVPEQEDARGIRALIIEAIGESEVDVHSLRMMLRERYGKIEDEHNIVHVLHKLHSQNVVTFVERGNGAGAGGAGLPTNIRLTDIELRRQKRDADERLAATQPVEWPPQNGDDTASPKTYDVTPLAGAQTGRRDPRDYPILGRLLGRVTDEAAEREAIDKLRVLAEQTHSIDQTAGEILYQRANEREAALTPLTDIEQ